MKVDEKQIINCKADLNQLHPLKYSWARDAYKKGLANHWIPEEISMATDISHYTDKLTDSDKAMVDRNLGFFITAESLAANNIFLGLYRKITNPECRQYLLRQAFEEAIHIDAYNYMVSSLPINIDEIAEMYHTNQAIRDKDMFCDKYIQALFSDKSTDEDIMYGIFAFACIMEGLFFRVGFSQILSLRRRNLMPGICEQIEYIFRDETLHIEFGINVLNTIFKENPNLSPLVNKKIESNLMDMMSTAVSLEKKYCKDSMFEVQGLPNTAYIKYIEYFANIRMKQIGLKPLNSVNKNPLVWMEKLDLPSETNFFERKVTTYTAGDQIEDD